VLLTHGRRRGVEGKRATAAAVVVTSAAVVERVQRIR
jgi:hypothetical protein